MLNQVIFVGRLARYEEPNNVVVKLTSSTTYEEWYITVKLPNTLLTNTKAYCTIGNLIGVKGHLEQGNDIVAEKITFLSATQRGGEEDGSNTVQESTETESQS